MNDLIKLDGKDPLVAYTEEGVLYLRGKLFDFDSIPKNDGQEVSREDFDKAVSSLRTEVFRGRTFATLKQQPEPSLYDAAALIDKVWILEEDSNVSLHGIFRVLDLDKGNVLREMIKSRTLLFPHCFSLVEIEYNKINFLKISHFTITPAPVALTLRKIQD